VRPTLKGRGLGHLAGAGLIACGLILTVAGVAGAAVTANPSGPDSVVVSSDFNLYPQTPIPPGCNVGSDFLTGTLYNVQRGSIGQAANAQPVSNSITLNEGTIGRLYPGDSITMTWTGFAPAGCNGEAVGVSLAVKSASSPSFNASDNQALLRAFAYCGVNGTPCTGVGGAGNTLSLVMPGEDEACNYQVDAVIGGPLAIVGPNGSYYNDGTRGSNGKNSGGGNRLISSNNGGPGECATTTIPTTIATTTIATTTIATTTIPTTIATTTIPTTIATTTIPTTIATTTIPTTIATTTTAATTTVVNTTQETSTTLGTTTTGATTTAATTTTGATTTISRATPPPEETVEGTTVTNPETLPVTGSNTWPAARIGVLMVLAGVAALALSKRRGAQA
jgi:hypothetical protein